MQVTQRQIRDWILLFPRHPAAWLLAAGLIVFFLANRGPRNSHHSDVPASSQVSQVTMTRAERAKQYAWLIRKRVAAYEPLVQRIAVPAGFTRVEVEAGSFAEWLRHLPVMPANAPVTDGRSKPLRLADDPAIAAVIDLHPTNRGLLNAANMAVRLRAEYLWSAGRMADSHFTFTSGDLFDWKRFAAGERPLVKGRSVTWKKEVDAGDGRPTFTAFVETMMRFSSSINLERDTTPATDEPAAGDLFVIVGRPGHAVTILDVAVDQEGHRVGLLGEGLTPPQSLHVLRGKDGSAWFKLDRSEAISTPTWGTLTWRHFRRWP